jgi:hypothetical protein
MRVLTPRVFASTVLRYGAANCAAAIMRASKPDCVRAGEAARQLDVLRDIADVAMSSCKAPAPRGALVPVALRSTRRAACRMLVKLEVGVPQTAPTESNGEQISRKKPTADAEPNGYGLGNVPIADSGVTFRGHNDSIDSFTAVLGYTLRKGSGYVLMANGGEGVDFAGPAAHLIQS